MSEAWKNISEETITKSFKKARLLDYYDEENFEVGSQEDYMNIISQNMEELDFDDPYLDEEEDNYLDSSELIYDN